MRALDLALAVLLFAVDCEVIGVATPMREERELVTSQLKGMKESREQLVSGIIRGAGTDLRKGDSNAPDRKRPVKFLCAFDFQTDRFHFSRDTDEQIVIHQIKPEARNFIIPVRPVYIRTPDCSLYYNAKKQYDVIERHRPSVDPSPDVAAFDPRCMGLSGNSVFDVYNSLNDVYKALLAKEVVAGVSGPNSSCRVVLQDKRTPDTFITVWFDPEHKYLPIRTEVCLKTPSSPPFQRSRTTWQHISGVWVPIAFQGEDFDFSGKVLQQRIELAFEWESVNKPVADEYFSASGMGAPPGTPIEFNKPEHRKREAHRKGTEKGSAQKRGTEKGSELLCRKRRTRGG